MADWLAFVKMAQEWITSPRTMFVFLIAIAIVLGLLFTVGQHDFVYLIDHYVFLWFLMAVCLAGLVVHGLFDLGSWLKLKHRLNHAASDENEILNRFAEKNSSTIFATFGEPAASALADEGILRVSKETGRVHQDGGITYYSVSPRVFRYLRNRKQNRSSK
jgi:hypothetical protein